MSDAEAIAGLRENSSLPLNSADIEAMADLITNDVVSMPPNQSEVVEQDATRS